MRHIKKFNEGIDIDLEQKTFEFSYNDLKMAFEEGGENTVYDDMHGYSSTETFEEWFGKWFDKRYK